MMAPQSTPGPARIKMLSMDFLKTCQSQLNADSKMSTGMKTSKIIWGLSCSMIEVDYPRGPKNDLK